MKKNTSLTIRIEEELKNRLMAKGNYSEYIRSLIVEDEKRNQTPEYIDSQIKKLTKELEELKSIKK